jgi:ribosomal protein S18 acetylase RimI-like enzyme
MHMISDTNGHHRYSAVVQGRPRIIMVRDGRRIQEINLVSNFPVQYTDAYYARVPDTSTGMVAVASTGTSCAQGAIMFRIHGSEAYVETLAVHPTYRRRGVATLLMGAAMTEARARGAHTVALDVQTHAPLRSGRAVGGAMALYLNLGFTPVGPAQDIYTHLLGNARNGVRMRRTLV